MDPFAEYVFNYPEWCTRGARTVCAGVNTLSRCKFLQFVVDFEGQQ